MNGLLKLADQIARLFSYIAAAGLFSLMAIVFVGVFYRYVLQNPIIFRDDITGILLGMTIFTAYPAVTLSRRHIKVDVLSAFFQKFPVLDRLRLVLIDIGSILMVLFITHKLWLQAVRYDQRETGTIVMDWPLAPFLYIFTAMTLMGAALFALRAFQERGRAGDKAESISL